LGLHNPFPVGTYVIRKKEVTNDFGLARVITKLGIAGSCRFCSRRILATCQNLPRSQAAIAQGRLPPWPTI
jgi:hypothetical protein